jgi:hypothetical protein
MLDKTERPVASKLLWLVSTSQNRSNSLKNFLFALTLGAVSIPAMSAEVINETFENINAALLPGPGGYIPVTGGTSFISNGVTWSTGGNSIDFINAAYGSPTGSVGVDLNGGNAGSISTIASIN